MPGNVTQHVPDFARNPAPAPPPGMGPHTYMQPPPAFSPPPQPQPGFVPPPANFAPAPQGPAPINTPPIFEKSHSFGPGVGLNGLPSQRMPPPRRSGVFGWWASLTSKVKYIIIAVAAFVIIGAIVGGAVGGTIGKKKAAAASEASEWLAYCINDNWCTSSDTSGISTFGSCVSNNAFTTSCCNVWYAVTISNSCLSCIVNIDSATLAWATSAERRC